MAEQCFATTTIIASGPGITELDSAIGLGDPVWWADPLGRGKFFGVVEVIGDTIALVRCPEGQRMPLVEWLRKIPRASL